MKKRKSGKKQSPFQTKTAKIIAVLIAAAVTIIFAYKANQVGIVENAREAQPPLADLPPADADVAANDADEKVDEGEVNLQDPAQFSEKDFFIRTVLIDKDIRSSFESTFSDNKKLAGFLSQNVMALLKNRIDLAKDIQTGDKATVIFKVKENAQPRLYGMRYACQGSGHTHFAYLFWEKGKSRPEFFDNEGIAYLKRLKLPPVDDYRSMQREGATGTKPIGLAFLTDNGAKAVLPFNGVVTRMNWLPQEQGNCVEVQYAGTGVFASFYRLESLSSKMNVGASFERGTVLGRVGDLGGGLGNGVRYVLRSASGEDAASIDPYQFHQLEGYRLPDAGQGMLKVIRSKLDAMFEHAV